MRITNRVGVQLVIKINSHNTQKNQFKVLLSEMVAYEKCDSILCYFRQDSQHKHSHSFLGWAGCSAACSLVLVGLEEMGKDELVNWVLAGTYTQTLKAG